MIKVTSSDKGLLMMIVNVAVTFGVMLAMIGFLGELHGAISTIILLIVQTSFLTKRVTALERELRISHGSTAGEPNKIA